MILTLVAELLAGETLLADRGPVDSATAAAEDVELWGLWRPEPEPSADAIQLVGSRPSVAEPVA